MKDPGKDPKSGYGEWYHMRFESGISEIDIHNKIFIYVTRIKSIIYLQFISLFHMAKKKKIIQEVIGIFRIRLTNDSLIH